MTLPGIDTSGPVTSTSSQLKRSGLSPVNGVVQDVSDAVITPATS